ncbi:probable cysteine--tRNA ligase, mitochondrial [Diorhabda sublineata]|uniref:probable cysteine--tRNA ligase, mitochondrial n=1 Tax=Diorhabda sublineata TaxID=1163346 RepID=UPI0024E184F9|nr:probable cysteine--tRNA ligase, mitochondrial [Diorhabda sublineata]
MFWKSTLNLLLKYKRNCELIRKTHCWISPQGFKTEINVYNCATRRKEPLILKNKDRITWYTCGPTVYDSSHIGHASCYVKLDIIQRILKDYFKYDIISCLNITDIDDKIIRRANELGVDINELTEKYEKEFLSDLEKLGIAEPSIIMKVTQNMRLIISFIEKLIEDDRAYIATDKSVYFNVNSIKKYGKLQNLGNQDEINKLSTIKKSSLDFALWKAIKEDGEPFWDSPWGRGRPGWHVECSALASSIFGENIDIHAGGIDLRFPHHENEEAQSCAFHNSEQWVNYWIHTGHLQLNKTEKMSKSLKNTISIQDMLQKTLADVFRMSCIMSRYEHNMEYSEKLMSTAKNNYDYFKNFINSCNEFKDGFLKATINEDIIKQLINRSKNNIHNALCDNFDTPSVIKVLNELASTTNSMLYSSTSSSGKNGVVSVLSVRNFVTNILEMFGLNLNNSIRVSNDSSNIIDILSEFRKEVRTIGLANKNENLLKLCDNVRSKAKDCGVTFKDHGKVSSWSLK